MEFAALLWSVAAIAEPLGRMIADLFESGKERQDDATALDAFDLLSFEPFSQFVDRLLIELAQRRRRVSGQNAVISVLSANR